MSTLSDNFGNEGENNQQVLIFGFSFLEHRQYFLGYELLDFDDEVFFVVFDDAAHQAVPQLHHVILFAANQLKNNVRQICPQDGAKLLIHQGRQIWFLQNSIDDLNNDGF